MQATNSKHMSCQREGEREGEREREREGDGIRGSNQLFIYCLLLVCFSFHCVSFRVISHCEGPHKCAPSHSDCHDLSHGFVNSSQAGTGNNFISQLASFYAYYLWSLSTSHCFSPFPVPITHGISLHCPDQSSQSANRPVDNPPPRAKTTQEDGTMGNSSYSLFGRKTISELRAIVRSRRREITFVSFIYPAIFFSSENVPNFVWKFQLNRYAGNCRAQRYDFISSHIFCSSLENAPCWISFHLFINLKVIILL